MSESALDISALYGLPLAEFTKARNELAKRARAQGKAEQAQEIARLRKPTLPAWALNMLPRLRKGELRELLRVGEQAEAAQAGTLAGTGAADQLQQASEQLRRAARDLAAETGEILVKDGHAAREETQQRIAMALERCAVTSEGRQRLHAGQFTQEPEAAGFDLFAQLSAAPTAKRSKSAPKKASQRPSQASDGKEPAAALRAARQALDKARGELQERRAERAAAERANRDAEHAARAKQQEADGAWGVVGRTAQRAARAQAAELEAKQRLDDAKERLRTRK